MSREIVDSGYHQHFLPYFSWSYFFRRNLCTKYPFVEKQKWRGGRWACLCWSVMFLGILPCSVMRSGLPASQGELLWPHLSLLFCVRAKKRQLPHGKKIFFSEIYFRIIEAVWSYLIIHKYSYLNNLSLYIFQSWWKDLMKRWHISAN